MANRFVSPRFAWTTSDGAPAAGYTLAFYEAGTSTPKTVYAEAAATTPLANPVSLNADGYSVPIFGSGAYKVVLLDESGAVEWTEDDYTFAPGVPIGIAEGGTGATTAAGARDALGLGTVATLNAGTGVGDVPVIEAGGQLAASLIPTTVTTGLNVGSTLFISRNAR